MRSPERSMQGGNNSRSARLEPDPLVRKHRRRARNVLTKGTRPEHALARGNHQVVNKASLFLDGASPARWDDGLASFKLRPGWLAVLLLYWNSRRAFFFCSAALTAVAGAAIVCPTKAHAEITKMLIIHQK